MYGDRRQPWHPSARRTYTRSVAGYRVMGVGRERIFPPVYIRRAIGDSSLASAVTNLASGDPVAAIQAAVPGISSLFSSQDGGPNDKRVVLLAQAYQQAVAGLNVATPYPGTGLPYLQNWVNDQPPHPGYSVQIAQELIAAIASGNRGAAQAAVPVSVGPAQQNVPAAAGLNVNVPVGPSTGGLSPLLLIAIIGGVVLLAKR